MMREWYEIFQDLDAIAQTLEARRIIDDVSDGLAYEIKDFARVVEVLKTYAAEEGLI